ncbi:restriction endonuclease subunit S, partial [archaeon]|nr:restriction endonuclease subunit S [archaeon]
EYIVFRTNKNIFSEFLYYFLLRSQFREEGAKRMTGAVGHKRVSKEFIENSMIALPPLVEQHLIVAKLNALSAETKKLEAIYARKLADLEELKKSILTKAFKGELVNE